MFKVVDKFLQYLPGLIMNRAVRSRGKVKPVLELQAPTLNGDSCP